MSGHAPLNPFLLAAVIPEPDPRLLPLLRSSPHLASQQDPHGYSLLHAASSYNHVDLLQNLVSEFHVDVNLLDEDGETCLFVAESVEVARSLVEDLGIDINVKNEEGMTAAEKMTEDAEFPEVAAFLVQVQSSRNGIGASNGANGTTATNEVESNQHHTEPAAHLPPLPPNVTLDIKPSTDQAVNGEELQEPDPEFRRRIEELAAKDNFQTEEGQRELRDLITDAVRGVGGDGRDVRRRVG